MLGVAIWLVIVVSSLFIQLGVGFGAREVMRRKGLAPRTGFLLGLLLGVIGLAITIALRPKLTPEEKAARPSLGAQMGTRWSDVRTSHNFTIVVAAAGAIVAVYVGDVLISGGGPFDKILSTLATVVSGIMVLVLFVVILYWVASQYPEPWRERMRVAVFVGPALLLLIFGLIIPSFYTAKLSLYRGTATDKWYGLGNFRDMFTDRANLLVLRNNLWWVILVTVFSTFIGLSIARFADRMRGEAVAKAAVFIPTAISMVGAGVIWRFIYANNPRSQNGLLNYIWVGMGDVLPGKQEPHYWLQDNTFFGIKSDFLPGSNTVFMIIVMIWIQAGFATVVLSAAMKGVPDDLVEAAKIDGATDRQAFYRIVLPYVKTTVVTVVTTTIIAVLKVFDIVQAMGLGGAFENNVLANQMYTESFTKQNQGYGAAAAVVIFIAVIPVVFINARNQRAMRESR
ncbi:MAG: sugar ABC transporter permease [Actinomycetota bacterium]|nr:sugar ABC transporter permease [Actinomycetota bacterium]